MLKLFQPLYGLADSGEYWNVAFAVHFRKNLDMETFTSDILCSFDGREVS